MILGPFGKGYLEGSIPNYLSLPRPARKLPTSKTRISTSNDRFNPTARIVAARPSGYLYPWTVLKPRSLKPDGTTTIALVTINTIINMCQ